MFLFFKVGEIPKYADNLRLLTFLCKDQLYNKYPIRPSYFDGQIVDSIYARTIIRSISEMGCFYTHIQCGTSGIYYLNICCENPHLQSY